MRWVRLGWTIGGAILMGCQGNVASVETHLAQGNLTARLSGSEPCGSAANATLVGVQAPLDPQPYTLPDLRAPTTHFVTSAAMLQSRIWQLNAAPHPHQVHDIIVQNGIYNGNSLSGHLSVTGSYRIWAETPGGVEFQFGVAFGGYDDTLFVGESGIRGVNFNITDLRKAVPTGVIGRRAAVANWGRAEDFYVRDVELDGHYVIDYGLELRQSRGLVVERVELRNIKKIALLSELPNAESMDTPAQMQDIVVAGVIDTAWQQQPLCQTPEGNAVDDPYCPGTAEIGIWIGEEATLNRVRIRDVYWAGIVTASNGEILDDVTMRSIDIDDIGDDQVYGAGTGVYVERTTHGILLENFCIGPETERGINLEWDHFDPNTSARFNTFGNGLIESWYAGVYMDYGSRDNHLRKIVFRNASWAPVSMYHNHLPGGCVQNTWENLVFENLPASACDDVVFSYYQTDCATITESVCD